MQGQRNGGKEWDYGIKRGDKECGWLREVVGRTYLLALQLSELLFELCAF